LRKEKSNFTTFLNIKEYFNYSKAFDELKGKLKEKEEKNIQYKIEKYKELYEEFYKSFTDSLNKFLNNSNEKEMTNRIKVIVKSLDKISKENKDNIIKAQKYIDLLYKNLNSKVELSLIRNNDKNKYTLSKTKLVETNEDYYCFEEGEKIIPDCDDTNYENIYKFLEKENANKKNENMLYLLMWFTIYLIYRTYGYECQMSKALDKCIEKIQKFKKKLERIVKMKDLCGQW